MKVKKGDTVYVLGQGAGQVPRVSPDGGFDVVVAGRGEVHYTADGTLGVSRAKRVYYHDPIIVEPCADERFWDMYVRLARALWAELQKELRPGECGCKKASPRPGKPDCGPGARP